MIANDVMSLGKVRLTWDKLFSMLFSENISAITVKHIIHALVKVWNWNDDRKEA